ASIAPSAALTPSLSAIIVAPAIAVPVAGKAMELKPTALALPVLQSAAAAPDAPVFDGEAAKRPAEASEPVVPASSPEAAPTLSLPVKTFTLKNGLKVVVHTDQTSPVVAVSITYKVGSQHETPGLSGFAHLFEHLMAQGTKSLKPREISHLIESNGGVRNAYTMRSNTTYHSVVPKSALKTVLWAEAERMSTLNVDDRALALEKQVVLEEMRLRYVNAAYAKARDAGMAETAFGQWQNQHTTIGEAEDVRNARLEDVRAFYLAHYAPNNAVLSLAGDVTEAEARQLAERFFGPLETRVIAPAPDLSEPRMTGETRRVIEDKFAKVPLLMTAWNAPARGTKDYWALTLLGEILGAGEDSPLYRALVKDAKIALSVSTNFPWWTGPFNPGGPDLFGLMTTLKPGVGMDAVLALSDRVLAQMAAEGPTAEQLAAAKTTTELSWTKDLEQLIDRAKNMGSYAALVGDPRDLSRDFAALMSVTAADIQNALNEWVIGKGRAVVEARPTPDLALEVDPATPKVPDQKPRPEGEARPEIDAQRPAAVPTLERFTLSNGLKVVFTRDSRLPLLEARLSIPSGRTAEGPGEDGLSAAVSELLLQGAEGKDARALSAGFAALGWKLDIGRGLESLNIDAAGLSRNAASFFKELALVLSKPTFPEDEVSLWKENKVTEMKSQRSKPDFMASERMKAELFGGHPYGRPALTDEQIESITRAKTAAYASRALAAQGATLVLAGDADPVSLRAQLEAAFAGWTGRASAAAIPEVPPQRDARLALVDRPGSKQANLTVSQMIALSPTDPDYLAFLIMNQILGGSATSRLFVNLRVDKGYTYGAYSRPQVLEKGIFWTASAEVRNEVAAPALAEMNKEIAGMRDGLVSEQTLGAVKRYLAGLFLLKSSSIDYSADTLAGYERNKQSAEREMASYLERLNALTPEDIRRVAQKYLAPDKMVTVVVGDASALRL
ncbi:MAG: insulinase family protein, partial [Elusimicrobiota bacterium]|nr:insulinase family protein [Elusimicrobiota bacterium]